MPAKKTYPKPDTYETEVLRRYMQMEDWHFNIIKERCVEIDTCAICWDSSKQEYLYANVYGLIGVRVSTNERCVSNFFIQYGRKVYQTFYLMQVSFILDLLKKEFLYDVY